MTAAGSILITGAASGMGAEHARLLASRGHHVCLADVQPVANVISEIVAAGYSASGHQLDVSCASSWDSLVDELGGLPPLRGLINNAGVNQREGILATDEREWDRVLDINLKGPFLGMKKVAPKLRDNGGGSIVNVSSAGGLTGYHAAAYGASKWGLRGLTKTASGEFAPWGIRVNSVHPGLIDTPLVSQTGPFRTSHLRSIPLGRAGQANEVAELIAFLVSDAASYITGSEIAIDGGLISNGIYGRMIRET